VRAVLAFFFSAACAVNKRLNRRGDADTKRHVRQGVPIPNGFIGKVAVTKRLSLACTCVDRLQ
jgi:hypothetical protein